MDVRRRRFVWWSVAVAVCVAAASLSGTGPFEAAAKGAVPPNIVLVLFDDADKALVESLPKIKAHIADQGMTFNRAYTSLPQCCPARASILTGMYVHNHGVLSNLNRNHGGYRTFKRRGMEGKTIARELKAHGYETALVGKYLNEYGPISHSAHHRAKYWSKWFAIFGQDYRGYSVNNNGRIRHYGRSARDYATNVFSRELLKFVRRKVDRGPFFAFASFTAPHSPEHRPPGKPRAVRPAKPLSLDKPSFNEADMSDKAGPYRSFRRLSKRDRGKIVRRYRRRYRMALEVDDFVGKLVSKLRAKGELDNTYIVVTSDNGWMQGEHRAKVGKNVPYEESVGVPFIVRGPGVAPASTSSALVSLIDLFPTFSDMAGGTELRDGRSIVPILTGAATSVRSSVLIEWTHQARSVPAYKIAMTDRYKYVRHASGAEEVFDLQLDPYELENIVSTIDTPTLDGLRARYNALRDCSGDTCRTADS